MCLYVCERSCVNVAESQQTKHGTIHTFPYPRQGKGFSPRPYQEKLQSFWHTKNKIIYECCIVIFWSLSIPWTFEIAELKASSHFTPLGRSQDDAQVGSDWPIRNSPLQGYPSFLGKYKTPNVQSPLLVGWINLRSTRCSLSYSS